MQQVAGVYTFGAPRFGDAGCAEVLAQHYGGRLFRYVHAADLVSQPLTLFPNGESHPMTRKNIIAARKCGPASACLCKTIGETTRHHHPAALAMWQKLT